MDDSLEESTFVTMAKRVVVTEGLPVRPQGRLRRSSRGQFSFGVEPMHPELARSGTSISVLDGPAEQSATGVGRGGSDSADEVVAPIGELGRFPAERYK